uniref:Tetratricopeptide repeat protein n=1 Tax=Solanum tuberosum TaxID=4113 RepID=M1DHS5_SOLTU
MADFRSVETSSTEEVSREKGEVSTDLKSTVEEVSSEKGEVSTDLKTTVEEVSSEKGEVSTDLKSTVEEVSSEKGEVSTDPKSTVEEVSSEKGEVSTDLKSTVEEVSSEKGEVSTDPKSTVEEVSSEKGEVSTDLTSTIEKVSTHLKESNPPLKMSTPTEKVSREKGEVSTDLKFNPPLKMSTPIEEHFPSSKQQKISDIEHQIRLCIKVLESVPQEKRESNRERTVFEYLKGRFYNAIPDVYKEEAERHLQKSIEINPHLRNAWNCLASYFTKKGDFDRAEKYYQIALKMVIFRCLFST